VQYGAFLFLDPSFSGDKSRACTTCHPGGGSDNLYYRDGEAVAAGDESGRRSLPLRGLWESAPYFWDNSAPTLRAAIERMLAVEMRGAKPRTPRDLEALEAYVLSIQPFDNGRIELDGAPVEPVTLAALRGFGVFQKAKCASCHAPPAFTSAGLHDIGTGGAFSVPSLRGMSADGPFGHDGRWGALEDAVAAHVEASNPPLQVNEQEILQLAEYLRLL
jgi:cytochrome c peroxidase